ncbi:LysR family transcriptional regulator [Sciscionella marina]|uniref:LysR family transcriptional regulator n=1 Tax=Sciscionella marina TaxID=508770 RepID=UPI0003645F29|nr:LysR family transcriptional regulator [Sciscionella marina]
MDSSPERIAAELTPRLALLDAVRRYGNLTAAAADIGIPQPTASRWLAAIAQTCGVDLVARSGRRIELTRAGHALAEAASTAITAMGTGAARAIEAADPEQGHVVFAFLHTMGQRKVPELLRDFRAAHPGVRFTLTQDPHEVMLEEVRSGTVDLALTSPLPGADPEFETAPLFSDELVLVVGEQHRFAEHERVRMAWCRGETFVSTKAGYGLRGITDRLCAAAGFTMRPAFEGEEVDTVRGLVAAGLGIAVLPAREDGPLPGTVECLLAPRCWREVGLVSSTRRPLSPAARRFRDWALTRRVP